jgi:hypothetical protein
VRYDGGWNMPDGAAGAGMNRPCCAARKLKPWAVDCEPFHKLTRLRRLAVRRLQRRTPRTPGQDPHSWAELWVEALFLEAALAFARRLYVDDDLGSRDYRDPCIKGLRLAAAAAERAERQWLAERRSQ